MNTNTMSLVAIVFSRPRSWWKRFEYPCGLWESLKGEWWTGSRDELSLIRAIDMESWGPDETMSVHSSIVLLSNKV